jgi:hypothetical protein
MKLARNHTNYDSMFDLFRVNLHILFDAPVKDLEI